MKRKNRISWGRKKMKKNKQQSYLTDNYFTCIEASKAKKREAGKWEEDLWEKENTSEKARNQLEGVELEPAAEVEAESNSARALMARTCISRAAM